MEGESSRVWTYDEFVLRCEGGVDASDKLATPCVGRSPDDGVVTNNAGCACARCTRVVEVEIEVGVEDDPKSADDDDPSAPPSSPLSKLTSLSSESELPSLLDKSTMSCWNMGIGESGFSEVAIMYDMVARNFSLPRTVSLTCTVCSRRRMVVLAAGSRVLESCFKGVRGSSFLSIVVAVLSEIEKKK